MGLIKVSDWAAKQGFSRQNAYKIIKAHNIPFDRETHRMDEELADRIWAESQNPAKRRGGAAAAEAAQNALPFDEDDEFPTPQAGGPSRLSQAQLTELLLKIQQRKLNLDEMKGKVVSLASVRAFEAAIWAEASRQLQLIGSELKDDLFAAESPNEIQQMIDARIYRALRTMAAWRPDQEA